MFNYTKDVIINNTANVVIGTGVDAAHNGLAVGEFAVKRAGNYKFANIVDGKVFYTPGTAGTNGTVTITVGTALTAGSVYRLSLFVSTPSKELSDYAYANYAEFGKPVMVEVRGTGVAANDAAAIKDALDLALQPDNKLYTTSISSNVVTLSFTKSWMKLAESHFESYDEMNDKYENSANVTIAVGTPNVEEFATANWLVENLRFPSYPNVRYKHPYADEAPVDGVTYDQFAFEYAVKRSVPGGVSAVGQFVNSVVTIVFYVPSTAADTFKGYFTDGGCTIVAHTPHANSHDIVMEVPSEAVAALDERVSALED